MGLPEGVAPCGVARLARKLEAFAPRRRRHADPPGSGERQPRGPPARRPDHRRPQLQDALSDRRRYPDALPRAARRRRQIINLVVPGDFAGMPVALRDALYSVRALTDVHVEVIPIRQARAPLRHAAALAAFCGRSRARRRSMSRPDPGGGAPRSTHRGFLLELLTRLPGHRPRRRVLVPHPPQPGGHRRRAGAEPALRQPGPAAARR